MALSLWILKDALAEFSPDIQCKSAKIELTGLRLYQPGMPMRGDTLYLAPSDTFFRDGDQTLVCVNRGDALRLGAGDLLTVSNAILDAFQFYERWRQECARRIAEGCSLTGLLDCSADVFGVPCMIVDAAQQVAAQSRDILKAERPEDWQYILSHKSLPEDKLIAFNQIYKDTFYTSGVITIPAGFFPTKSYCRHVLVNEERLATIILKAPEGELSQGTLHLLELFVPLVREWILSSSEHAEGLRPTSYFTQMLDGVPGTQADVLRQLSLFGWQDGCRKQVFAVRSRSGPLRFDMHLSRSLANEELGVFTIPYRDGLVILCDLDLLDYQAFLDNLCAVMGERGYCGASSFPFTGLDQFARSYRQALTALEHSPQAPGKLYRCQDVAMRMVAKIVDENASSALLHPALAAIRAYDRRHRTEFYSTLFCFLRNERRHRQTAEDLFIHRNTLFQRLEKLQELWPLDLDDPEERFYLLFSFYQERFMEKPAHLYTPIP